MHPIHASGNRPPATALAGLAFLISLATRRPLIGKAARRWPWLTSYPPGGLPYRTQAGLTAAWGIGLLAAAAVQGAGAITGGLGFTSPAGLAARSLIALIVEAILAALTIAWLHRSPATGSPARSATPDPGPDRSSWQQQDHRDLSPR